VSSNDPRRTELERDLYAALLDLYHVDDPREAVRGALALAARTLGAEHGYMEIYRDATRSEAETIDTGLTDEERERAQKRVSRGIIAEAIAEGRTVHTSSALADTRFRERKSVQLKRVGAVVCAPIGDAPVLGSIYLEGRSSGGFADDDLALFERVVFHIAPVVRRLAHPSSDDDATDALRVRLSVESIVGRSAALARVFEQLELVAKTDIAVLLTGASGTGKSLVARAIHGNSLRRLGPFVHVNCANLPTELLENELFGAVRGGHSTATEDRKGKVAAASGGTLFLDEVAELSLDAQAKLLTLLQEKIYFPVGADQQREADARVVTATNADLAERVRERRFREDLYYRINVLPIRMPSLAERVEDIPALASHLAYQRASEAGLEPIPIAPAALFWLQNQEWSGNIRELENVVIGARLRANGDGAMQIETQHFAPAEDGRRDDELSYHEATRAFQRRLVAQALDAEDGVVARAADRLQITRSHMYNLIRLHGLGRHNDS
jgi:Nif-specific regulatory protein